MPYALAQHSGPWHLREAIAGSKYVTADMDQADIVYVYDHCYYMLWLAQVASPLECLPSDPKTIAVVLTCKCSPCIKHLQKGRAYREVDLRSALLEGFPACLPVLESAQAVSGAPVRACCRASCLPAGRAGAHQGAQDA